jgi:hypothetical protein
MIPQAADQRDVAGIHADRAELEYHADDPE